MAHIEISKPGGRLVLTKPRPPSLLVALLSLFSQTARADEVFVFDRGTDTLSRNGRKLCPLSHFQSARIDKHVGEGAGYGLSILLVTGQKITLVDAFRGPSQQEMDRVADAVSRYTDVKVLRET